MNERKVVEEERSRKVDVVGLQRQINAARSLYEVGGGGFPGTYHWLGQSKVPTLVVNGDNDVLVPTEDGYVLNHHIPNAQLHIYPNAGHGFLFQYGSLFAQQLNIFLDN